jgi:hypothetical protein
LVEPKDQHKTDFTTLWGTFVYLHMPFGLNNVSATFQRAKDRAFSNLINKIIRIYQDDLAVFSKQRKYYVHHLQEIFKHLQEIWNSLNPKKAIFGVTEGKLLGCMVSTDGLKIDTSQL